MASKTIEIDLLNVLQNDGVGKGASYFIFSFLTTNFSPFSLSYRPKFSFLEHWIAVFDWFLYRASTTEHCLFLNTLAKARMIFFIRLELPIILIIFFEKHLASNSFSGIFFRNRSFHVRKEEDWLI